MLANSIAFMRNAIIAREMSSGIAEGDVGRVYEVMKVCQVILKTSTIFIDIFAMVVPWPFKVHAIHICGLRSHKVHKLPPGISDRS